MQLVFTRNQQQLGGKDKSTFRFSLDISVRMTDEEKSLTSQYTAWYYQLYVPGEESPHPTICVRDAHATATITTNDAMELLAIEESIRAACESFNTELQVMASFGGETVIEIGADQNGEDSDD